jgi:hypothetical protein
VVDKAHILAEIRRTAAANAGVPLGMQRFTSETGIRKTDWYGTHWARWGDAIREAGLAPNTFQEPYTETFLLEQLVHLIRELGHYPVEGEIRLKARNDPEFPAATTFLRLGPKHQRAAKLVAYAQTHGYDDIMAACSPFAQPPAHQRVVIDSSKNTAQLGFVYLIKFGRHYKIGRSNAVGRRQRELAIQLPEQTRLVHAITTDDPVGIEAYWHRRFEAKRGNGEWFELAAADIAAFKRRKFM